MVMGSSKLRVLIVDDTVLYRKILSDVLRNIPQVEVIGSAPNGKIALSKIEQLHPDLITLDVEMPEMDGLQTLEHLRRMSERPAVIMVSSLTRKDAMVTMKALQLGAFDFITKPEKTGIQENVKELTQQFIPKINALLRRKSGGYVSGASSTASTVSSTVSAPVRPATRSTLITPPRAVTIGISTGGPQALGEVIPRLPGDFPVPIYIVQHMPPVFTRALAESLDKKSALTVVEAQNGVSGKPGHVYIAPGGKQMKIVRDGIFGAIRLTDDPPENHCKPSADYLFRSAKEVFGPSVLAVIMTGMGRDGTEGLKVMKQSGAYVLAQDEATSVVFGMPMEAIKAGVVDEIVSLNNIPARLVQIVKNR